MIVLGFIAKKVCSLIGRESVLDKKFTGKANIIVFEITLV